MNTAPNGGQSGFALDGRLPTGPEDCLMYAWIPGSTRNLTAQCSKYSTSQKQVCTLSRYRTVTYSPSCIDLDAPMEITYRLSLLSIFVRENMSTTTFTSVVKRSDAVALWIFMAAGVGIAIWAVWSAVARIIEVLPNRDVPVPAEFSGTMAEAPIGVDGAPVAIEIDRAIITAPTLPEASLWALVIQQAVVAIAVVGVVVCLVWLARNVSRSIVFSRTNTVLVTTAGFTGIVAYFTVPFFGNMAANGAFAMLSERTFDNVVISVELFPLILLTFIAATAATVFAVGERLQRDTDGLV